MTNTRFFSLVLMFALIGANPAMADQKADQKSEKKPESASQPAAGVAQSTSSSSDQAACDQLLVVLVYDETCLHACGIVRPLIKDITQKCGNKVKYVELNTSKQALKESAAAAKSLGIKTFLEDGVDLVPVLAIFSPKRKRLKELQGQKDKEVYVDAIEKCLSKN